MTLTTYDAMVNYNTNEYMVNLNQKCTHFAESGDRASKKSTGSKSGRNYFKEIGGNAQIHIIVGFLGKLVFKMRLLSKGIFNDLSLPRMRSIPCYKDMIRRFELNVTNLTGRMDCLLENNELDSEIVCLSTAQAIFYLVDYKKILDLSGKQPKRLEACRIVYGNDKHFYFFQKLVNDCQFLKFDRTTGEYTQIPIDFEENFALVNNDRMQTLNKIWTDALVLTGSDELNFFINLGLRQGVHGRLENNRLRMQNHPHEILDTDFIDHRHLRFRIVELFQFNGPTLALSCTNNRENEKPLWQQSLRITTTNDPYDPIEVINVDHSYVGALYCMGLRAGIGYVYNVDIFDHSNKPVLQVDNLLSLSKTNIWMSSGFLAYLQLQAKDKADLVIWDLKERVIVVKKPIDDPKSFIDVAILPDYRVRIAFKNQKQQAAVQPMPQNNEMLLPAAAPTFRQNFLVTEEFSIPNSSSQSSKQEKLLT